MARPEGMEQSNGSHRPQEAGGLEKEETEKEEEEKGEKKEKEEKRRRMKELAESILLN